MKKTSVGELVKPAKGFEGLCAYKDQLSYNGERVMKTVRGIPKRICAVILVFAAIVLSSSPVQACTAVYKEIKSHGINEWREAILWNLRNY